MATITLTLKANIDGKDQEVSKAATIDDAVMPYFFQYYRIQLLGETDEDAFYKLADSIARRTTQDVQGYVRDLAISQIKLPNIEVTPNG